MFYKSITKTEMLKDFSISVSDCNMFPVMVTCDIRAERVECGWEFHMERINRVELHMGAGKDSIDITGQVLRSTVKKSIITTAVLNQEFELYNAVAELEAVSHA